MAESITGIHELQRRLVELASTGCNKANRAGMRAALSVVAKSLRGAVNASSASPAVKQGARKTIGQRYGKVGKKRELQAKVGFAVAKKGQTQRGVGVTARNIHWFVLGTAERRQGSGHPTGRIQPTLKGLTGQAFAAAAPAAIAAAKAKISAVVQREALKKAKG